MCTFVSDDMWDALSTREFDATGNEGRRRCIEQILSSMPEGDSSDSHYFHRALVAIQLLHRENVKTAYRRLGLEIVLQN